MNDIVWLAIIAVIGPIIMTGIMFFTNRANKREDWRRQDEVAAAVKHVALVAAAANITLVNIAKTGESTNKTGEATHRLVNSQRIVMLRAYAVLARSYSDDHPDDSARREAAENAEHDLSEAEAEAAKL